MRKEKNKLPMKKSSDLKQGKEERNSEGHIVIRVYTPNCKHTDCYARMFYKAPEKLG